MDIKGFMHALQRTLVLIMKHCNLLSNNTEQNS